MGGIRRLLSDIRRRLLSDIRQDGKLSDSEREFLEREFFLRATGRSYRIANQIIDDLFTKPLGTRIRVKDHYPTKNADKNLLIMLERRLKNDFPMLQYHVGHDFRGINIMRITKLKTDEQYNKIYDKDQGE